MEPGGAVAAAIHRSCGRLPAEAPPATCIGAFDTSTAAATGLGAASASTICVGTADASPVDADLVLNGWTTPSTATYQEHEDVYACVDVQVPLAEMEPTPQVDWDALQIEVEDRWDEEGIQEIASEQGLYVLLGLSNEDEMEKGGREEACKTSGGTSSSTISNDCDNEGIVMPAKDFLSDKRRIVYDENNPVMEPGSLYPSMKVFRIAIRQYAINNKFELGVEATCKSRYRGFCKGGDCPWSINARQEVKGSATIMVTVLNDEHTCTSSGSRKTKTATSSWVASKALPILRDTPHMGAKELQTKLQDEHKVNISYDTVWKGKEKALIELYGSWEESIQQLFNWKAAVLKESPNSVVEIDVRVEDGKFYFHRFFCALGPCIEGFLEGCRPYLSVDSTALNGRWSGQLASATSVDGHNWMYPVAFGIFDSETEDNWTWFMTQLHMAIGDLPLLAVCIDACNGSENAVKSVFSNAEKRVCFRHLMGNYVKSYAGSEHMYPAARAYRREVYDHHMAAIVRCDPEISYWLDTYNSLRWCRSGFNTAIKCDYITNNISDIFNNWIKDIKYLPVCELADKIREMIMVLFIKRRRIGAKLNGKILPAVIHVLKARTRGLGHFAYVKGDNYAAEVWENSDCHSRHIVKPYLHECSCEEWQHTGKPCQHALCLITTQQFRDVRIEDFVNGYYSVEKFRNAYSRLVNPLGDKSSWPKVDIATEVGASLGKRGVGRQWKNRIKGCLESGSGKEPSVKVIGKVKKIFRGKFKCPNCGQLGHRKNSPKCPLNGAKKRKRKPRKNITKGWFPKTDLNTSEAMEDVVDEDTSLQPPPMSTPTKESCQEVMPWRGSAQMNKIVQCDLSDGQGHNQLSQGLMNVDSGHETNEPNPEIGTIRKIARWSHEMKLFLIELLKDHDMPGLRTDEAWSKEAWTNIVCRLNAKFGSSFTLSQVKQKEQELKKDYRSVKELKEERGFGWDSERKMVTAPPNVWASLAARKNKTDAFNWQDKSFPYFDDLFALYDGRYAEGRTCHGMDHYANKSKNASSPSTQQAPATDAYQSPPSTWAAQCESGLQFPYSINKCITVLEGLNGLEMEDILTASDIFKSKDNREVFLSFRSDALRLAWITREIERLRTERHQN